MTPEELHSRILLHEIRTILLDETREGSQIPEEWKAELQRDPHNKSPYLVLADWLDERDDPLGELIRIQVELIGILPVAHPPSQYPDTNLHPFQTDYYDYGKKDDPLLTRRWEITKELYPPRQPPHYEHGILCLDLPNRKLGRTTRMLTDILRYCAQNQGKNILCLLQPGIAEELFDQIGLEILCHPKGWFSSEAAEYLWGNNVYFDYRQRLEGGRRITQHTADITFTDHACQQPLTIRPDMHAQWQQQALDDQTRNIRMLQLMLEDGTIQYSPPTFINPNNL